MHPDEQAIRDLAEAWEKATVVDDYDTIAGLMSEDATYLTPGNPPMRGREAFMALARSMKGRLRIEASGTFEEIQVLGDWAYAWRTMRVTVTPAEGGALARREGNTLSIFRREPDGRWVLTRDANLLANAES
jgi:uncharacterized protein (TIGR02246 family)